MYNEYDRLAIVYIGDYKIVTKVKKKLIFHHPLRHTYMYVNQAKGIATKLIRDMYLRYLLYCVLER